jgi:cytochrome c biogenesis protein CcmG/thiol:disulfide interchange protein DsbE
MKSILNIGLVLVFAAGALAAAEEQKEYPLAQSFTLIDVKGVEVTLDSLLVNGPVYLETWDLPCKNCIDELDALMPVYDSLKERGLQIVALSVDKPADEARVKAFVKSKKWPYICLLDPNKDAYNAYGVVIKPTAFLINQKGEIVYTHIGYKKGDENRIKAEFLKWLPEEPVEESPGKDE